MKCANCKRKFNDGDEAYERDVRRIGVRGTRVTFVDDVEIVCVSCSEDSP